MSLNGFFISPDGYFFAIWSDYLRHINAIIQEPEKFGFTKDEVYNTFRKFNEPLGLEGKAREELIVKAIYRGWVRIRKYTQRNADFWSVQVPELDVKYRRYIQDFVEKATKGERPHFNKPLSKWEEIHIADFKNNTGERYTFDDILKPEFVLAGMGSDGEESGGAFALHYSDTSPQAFSVYESIREKYKLKFTRLSDYNPLYLKESNNKWKNQFK